MDNDELTRMMEQTAMAGAVNQAAAQSAAQQYYVEEKEKSIADAQLEVDETMLKLHHLLQQDVKRMKDGVPTWDRIDEQNRVLTEDGVERAMQTLSFYINKENLLSNFSEEQINRIMLTFRLALNANFFMRYNTIFRQPTFQECKAILEKRLKDKQEIKVYTRQILGLKVDEEQIKQDILEEIEDRIEKELQKIRDEKRKENLREWELIFEELSQMVYATLNRAWKGEERGSLRRHTNISEVLGNHTPPPKQGGGLFRWGR